MPGLELYFGHLFFHTKYTNFLTLPANFLGCNKDEAKNEKDTKEEANLNNEDDPKNEDKPKNDDDPKNKDNLR